GALRRHLPCSASVDAARGPGDPAGARVRRPDDRRGRANAARPRAAQARGDVRRVRPRADPAAPHRRGRGRTRRDADPGDPRRPAYRARLPERGRGDDLAPPGRAVFDGTQAAALVCAHLGPHPRRRAVIPAGPDAERAAAGRAIRAARGFSAERVTRRPARPGLVLAGGGALATRAGAGREKAQGPLRDRGGARRRRGMADRRDPLVPLRGRGASADRTAEPDRRAGTDPSRRARAQPRAGAFGELTLPAGSVNANVAPLPRLGESSSEPPWATAIDRAKKRPSPVPGVPAEPAVAPRPHF